MLKNQLYKKALLFKTRQNFFAIKQFKLPDLGEKIKEATIKAWHVKEGDQVEEFDNLADVATDKLFTQIPSPYEGKINKIFYEVDQNCQVGDVLLEIKIDDDQEIDTVNEQVVEEEVQFEAKLDKTKTDQNFNQKEILASPAVRYYAKENKVMLSDVKGTGKKGRILKEDIINFLEKKTEKKIESKKKQEQKQQPTFKMDTTTANEYTDIDMNLFQKGMLKSMTYSLTVPHFHLHEEYDVTELVKIRQQFNNTQLHKISIFAFFVKTFSLALNKNPKINSTYEPEKISTQYRMHNNHNISIAVDSKNGLAAPNIKNVQNKSIKQIDEEVKYIASIADEGRITNDYLQGGTVALTNIGSISGYFANPINLPGQTCIVALGKVVKQIRYMEKTKTQEVRDILPISFGADHRILDGGTVAKFSISWREYLENPALLMSELK